MSRKQQESRATLGVQELNYEAYVEAYFQPPPIDVKKFVVPPLRRIRHFLRRVLRRF